MFHICCLDSNSFLLTLQLFEAACPPVKTLSVCFLHQDHFPLLFLLSALDGSVLTAVAQLMNTDL